MPDAISLKEKIDYLNKELNMNYINWNIDWTKLNAKELIDNALELYLNGQLKQKVIIRHVISSEFIEEYEVEEPTDFNGWQCEWWSTMNYEGKTIHIYGEAFYGRITLQLDE